MNTEDIDQLRASATVDQLPLRIQRKIEITGEHWLWKTPSRAKGYGYVHGAFPGDPDRKPSKQPAHRLVYELLIRVIPPGLELDHTCESRACVRPACLDEVTNAENQRRASWRQLTCRKRGHLFTPDNTIRRKGDKKICRECARENDRSPKRVQAQRDRRAAQRAVAA